jgi:hypothetical protein
MAIVSRNSSIIWFAFLPKYRRVGAVYANAYVVYALRFSAMVSTNWSQVISAIAGEASARSQGRCRQRQISNPLI